MFLQEIREIKSGRHERHQFGIVMAVATFLIGGFLWWRSGFYPAVFLIGLVFLAPVLFDKLFKTDVSIALLPLQKVWMAFAVVMGTIMSTLFLALFFFSVFTTVRGVNGIVGKPLLDTSWAPGARDSYWIKRDSDGYDATQSEKQY